MDSLEEEISKCYATWGKDYYDEYYGKKAPYPPVHKELICKILKTNKVSTLIDAGCGPASFLREIMDLDIQLYGFDLTPEMINEGKKVFHERDISSDRIWMGNILNKDSFICPKEGLKQYDAVICGGVLPHIPQDADRLAIQNIAAAVNPGGFCAVEARNKLFGLFSLNRYSYDLFVNDLISLENVKQSKIDSVKIDQLLTGISQFFRMDLPPIRKGKKDEPGYDEILSRTHNPFALKKLFEEVGFINLKVMFYHFHAFPPMFQSLMPDFFLKRSLEMELEPEDWRGYFMASAFYLVGYKPT